MKIKSGFVLRQVADTWVVLPLNRNVLNFDGMLTLNESGAFLWKLLERGAERGSLADAMTSEYNVPIEQVLIDVDEFIAKLDKAGCIAK